MAAKMGCFCAATLLPLACAYLAVPGEVGRRVGLRRVGMNRETGNVSFWVAAPLGVEAMDRRNFGIVAASLWHHGRWGGAESVIARRIFERHCAADGVVADLGSHVGYFTLLAAAHGAPVVRPRVLRAMHRPASNPSRPPPEGRHKPADFSCHISGRHFPGYHQLLPPQSNA